MKQQTDQRMVCFIFFKTEFLLIVTAVTVITVTLISYLYVIKFYSRTSELATLEHIANQSQHQSRMTIVTGRRRTKRCRRLPETTGTGLSNYRTTLTYLFKP